LASRILARFDEDFDASVRQSGSNEVWIAGQVVLRLGAAPGPGSLSFEARLASLLPPEVGYPRVLDAGLIEGHEYMVTSRLPGANLEAVWDQIPSAARVRALEDLWVRLEAVHRTPVDRVRAIGATSTPFYALDAIAAAHQLERLRSEAALVSFPGRQLAEIIEVGFDAMQHNEVCLSHTDASPGNVVWSDPHAVLIDFEFACVAPVDLDLENLCFFLLQDSDNAVRTRLRDLVSGPLRDRRSRDRLRAYAALRDIWRLNQWLDKAGPSESAADIESWAPLVRLREMASGSGWLSVVLQG
jgi:scyllo-inosamine 4-kinase